MAGTHISYTLDTSGWRRELRDHIARLENHEPFLRSVGEEILASVQDRFKTETGPDGRRWATLAPRTIESRLKKYGNAPITILRASGQLAGSINYQASGKTLTIGTGPEVEDYAAIHQFGGKAGSGLKSDIPARPFLGINDENEAEIKIMVSDYLLKVSK